MFISQQSIKEQTNLHFFIKAFIAYIFFIQGFYHSLGSTVILLYTQYPSAEVLSHFSIALLPFSLKYITGIDVSTQRL